jgi:hypothetical protein
MLKKEKKIGLWEEQQRINQELQHQRELASWMTL